MINLRLKIGSNLFEQSVVLVFVTPIEKSSLIAVTCIKEV
jgi:hypothetical protein